MGIVGWVQHNGVEALIGYYLLICVVGSMPVIPANAGYWSRWAYGFLHMFSGNLRAFATMLQNGVGKGLPDLPVIADAPPKTD
jgi:hypothetical protein